VEAESDEHVPSESEALTLRPGEVRRVDLGVRGGATIRGRVVDAAGQVVSGASIRVGLLDDETDRARELSGWRADALLEPRAVTTDGEGAFELARVRPGRTLLKVEREGYATLYRRDVVVRADEVVPHLSLTLVRAEEVAGVVRGDDGRPVADAFVVVTRSAEPRVVPATPAAGTGAPPPEPTVEATMSDRTDAQGRFRVEGVPPGAPYSVVVWFAPGHLGYAQGHERAIRRGVQAGARDVELVLAKAPSVDASAFPRPPPPAPAGAAMR